MDPKDAAEFLWSAWTNGIGTFPDSPVAAVWHTGETHTLCTYEQMGRAVRALVLEHAGVDAILDTPDPEDDGRTLSEWRKRLL